MTESRTARSPEAGCRARSAPSSRTTSPRGHAVGAVGDLFHQRSADALDDPALDLALDDRRVDQPAAVADCRVVDQLHGARSRIDVRDRDVRAVGERLATAGRPSQMPRARSRPRRVRARRAGSRRRPRSAPAHRPRGRPRGRRGAPPLPGRPRASRPPSARAEPASRLAAARPPRRRPRHPDWRSHPTGLYGTRPVSELSIRTAAGSRPSSAAAICARAVSTPWPWVGIPIESVTARAAVHTDASGLEAAERHSGINRGAARPKSTHQHEHPDADAAQPSGTHAALPPRRARAPGPALCAGRRRRIRAPSHCGTDTPRPGSGFAAAPRPDRARACRRARRRGPPSRTPPPALHTRGRRRWGACWWRRASIFEAIVARTRTARAGSGSRRRQCRLRDCRRGRRRRRADVRVRRESGRRSRRQAAAS